MVVMLLLGALFLATAAIGIALSAVFYGIVARLESDDVRPSFAGAEWRAPGGVEPAHANLGYRATAARRMASLAD